MRYSRSELPPTRADREGFPITASNPGPARKVLGIGHRRYRVSAKGERPFAAGLGSAIAPSVRGSGTSWWTSGRDRRTGLSVASRSG